MQNVKYLSDRCICTGKACLWNNSSQECSPDQDEPSLITGVIGCLAPGLTVNVIPNCCLVDDPLLLWDLAEVATF